MRETGALRKQWFWLGSVQLLQELSSSLIEGAELALLEGSHLVYWERPEAFFCLVTNFIEKQAAWPPVVPGSHEKGDRW